MLKVELDFSDEDIARWERLAREAGSSLDDMIHEAIVDCVEELDDYAAVKDRLATPGATIPDGEVWRRLGFSESDDNDRVEGTSSAGARASRSGSSEPHTPKRRRA